MPITRAAAESRRPASRLRALAPACGLAAGLAFIPLSSRAQDSASPGEADRASLHVSFGGGGVAGGTFALGRKTSAYAFSYEQPDVVGDYGLQVGYLNEGHFTQFRYFYEPVTVPLHYRDNLFLQLDRWSPLWARCRLGAALGPQLYFDTTTDRYRTDYRNRHGIGLRASVAGQCYPIATLAIELLAGRSLDAADFNASTVMLGLAYTPHAAPGSAVDDAGPYGEEKYLQFVGGQVVIDTFRVHLENGEAFWLTYGQTIENPFAFEVSFLNEHADSYAGNINRQSLATQLVISHDFGTRWLRLFAGAGPALSHTNAGVNGPCDGTGPVCNELIQKRYTQVNLLYDYGVRLAVGKIISVVLKFGRVGSSSRRTDTDIVSAGFGIHFH